MDKSISAFRLIILGLLLLFPTLFFTGCGKQVCSYCGLEKYCKEYDILGTTRYICDSCMNDVNSPVSGNVIVEYASPLVDIALYRGGMAASDNYTGFDNLPESDIPATDISYNEIPAYPESSDEQSAYDNQFTQSGNDTASINGDAFISNLAASLSALGYYVNPSETNGNIYQISHDNALTNIDVQIISDNKVTVSKYEGSTADDFDIVCIYSSMAFLGSSDYENQGYNLYSQAKQYGNFSDSGCSFYYIEYSEAEIGDNSPLINYEMSR